MVCSPESVMLAAEAHLHGALKASAPSNPSIRSTCVMRRAYSRSRFRGKGCEGVVVLSGSLCPARDGSKSHPGERGLRARRAAQEGREAVTARSGAAFNISSTAADWRGLALSNFGLSPFVLDGKVFASIEGFVQGIKFPEGDPRRD